MISILEKWEVEMKTDSRDDITRTARSMALNWLEVTNEVAFSDQSRNPTLVLVMLVNLSHCYKYSHLSKDSHHAKRSLDS